MAKEHGVMNPAKYTSEERRRFVRVERKWYVVYQLLDQTLHRVYTNEVSAETQNVGLGGVFFHTTEDVPVSSLIEMEIQLPGVNEPVVAIGRVTRVIPAEEGPQGGCDLAVEFVWMYPKDTSRLNDAIADLMRRKADVYQESGS